MNKKLLGVVLGTLALSGIAHASPPPPDAPKVEPKKQSKEKDAGTKTDAKTDAAKSTVTTTEADYWRLDVPGLQDDSKC